jgi:DegV family protein with EDD domain
MIGLLARYADKLRGEGLSAPEIVEKLQQLRQHQVLFAGLQTLEYLQKGGRLSKTSAAVGTIANIKPIISISQDGKVESFAKAIGVKRAISTIVKQVQACEIDEDFPIWSLCTVDDENCEALENALLDAGIVVGGRMQVGPTIGAHVGPGVYGVTFVKK